MSDADRRTASRQHHVAMLAPTPTLASDRRITQSVQSLVRAGHRVTLISGPQRIEPLELLDGDERVDLRLLSDDYWVETHQVNLPAIDRYIPDPDLSTRLLRWFDRKQAEQERPWRDRMYHEWRDRRFRERMPIYYLRRQIGRRLYRKFGPFFEIHHLLAWFFIEIMQVHARRPVTALFAHDLWSLPAAALAKQLIEVPLVYDTHEIATTVLENRKIVPWLERNESRLYQHVDRFFTVNQSLADYYAERSPRTTPTVVVNAPDVETMPSAPFRPWAPSSLRRLVIIGNFIDLDIVRPSVDALEQLGPEFHLWLIGDGHRLDELREYVRSRKCENRVRFVDRVPYNEVRPLLLECHVGIVPRIQKHINFGFNSSSKFFEYLHAGLPIVSDQGLEINRLTKPQRIGVTAEITENSANLVQAVREVEALVNEVGFADRHARAQRQLAWPVDFAERALGGL